MAAPDAAPATVLVADDDPLVRAVLRMALTAEGCAVIEARDVDEVANVDPDATIALVVLDINMPGGDVAASLDALRARAHPPAVLLLSGVDSPSDHIADRVDDFARKPIDLADFQSRVNRLLHRA